MEEDLELNSILQIIEQSEGFLADLEAEGSERVVQLSIPDSDGSGSTPKPHGDKDHTKGLELASEQNRDNEGSDYKPSSNESDDDSDDSRSPPRKKCQHKSLSTTNVGLNPSGRLIESNPITSNPSHEKVPSNKSQQPQKITPSFSAKVADNLQPGLEKRKMVQKTLNFATKIGADTPKCSSPNSPAMASSSRNTKPNRPVPSSNQKVAVANPKPSSVNSIKTPGIKPSKRGEKDEGERVSGGGSKPGNKRLENLAAPGEASNKAGDENECDYEDADPYAEDGAPKSAGTENKGKKGARTRTPDKLKFQHDWLNIDRFKKWLKKSSHKTANGSDIAHCIVCNKDLVCHKSALETHHKSCKKHAENLEAVRNPKVKYGLQNLAPNEMVRRAELLLVAFVCLVNIPFAVLDTLSPLMAHMMPGVHIAEQMKVRSTKGAELAEMLGDIFQEEVYQNMRRTGSFFSIIPDETTDCSTKKQCALSAVYVDQNTQKVTYEFFDVVETESGTADHLTAVIVDDIKKHNIPSENFVGFCADTCNTNFGDYNSVATKLKEIFPFMVAIKCSCHLIHLVAKHACALLPSEVENCVKMMATHLHRSPLRQKAFEKLQEVMELEGHRILSLSQTRWLSLQNCANRIIEQYPALLQYFKDFCKNEPNHEKGKSILTTLSNPFTLAYLEVLADTLRYINNFNTLFQSEKPLLYLLKHEVESLIRRFMLFYIVSNNLHEKVNVFHFPHKNPRYFVKLENVYLGISAHESINNLKSTPHKENIETFRKTILSFYIQLVDELKTRFHHVFTDKFFEVIRIIDPDRKIACQTPSLLSVFERFPFLKEHVNCDEAEQEWRHYCFTDSFSDVSQKILDADGEMNVEKYWSQVFATRNKAGKLIFTQLPVIIRMLIVIPHSNAYTERIFSEHGLIKTDQRSCLKTSTVKSVISTKHGVKRRGGILKFEPTRDMIQAKPKRRRQNEDDDASIEVLDP